MRFEGSLVRKEVIEAAVKAIFVDLFIPKLQQIGKRRAPVPILGNMQLARWLAEPGHHQHGRHLRPCNALLSNRQKPLTQILKTRSAPQRECQVYVAELARALDANTLRRTGTVRGSLPSSNSGACSGVPISRRASPRASTRALIELAKM